MNWPKAHDYCEELQNPRLCFWLDELRTAEIEADKYGMPKPVTGGLVTVFKLETTKGQLAIRCFHRGAQHDAERYQVIGRSLANTRLPYFAGYRYLAKGVKVGSKWYPIVTMPWVRGEPLKAYVEHNLDNPRKLRALAKAWLRMLSDLRKHGIAHGDLHHENILVEDGRLRLIDYDGMYVPELAGQTSTEVGHCHYQHPKRKPAHFGPSLDNFAGWVIYLSLLALSCQPDFWELVDDEHLLFTQQDFLHPRRSQLWSQLAEIPQVSGLAAEFRRSLRLPPEQVPPPHAQAFMCNWFSRKSAEAEKLPTPPPVQFRGPDWVLDYLPEQEDEPQEDIDRGPSLPPRVASDLTAALAVWLVICSFLALAAWAGFMQPLSAAATAVLFGIIQLLGVWFRRRCCRPSGEISDSINTGLKDNAPGA